ncbi:MAG: hypothetical protein H7Z76_11420 [Methylotenera sp.]|nr:hypothetical protein [Flavobacterium sp.]
MGIGFVFILHLIAIGIFSGLIAAIVSIITFFSSKKENRKRNIWTAIFSPFVGLYTLYMCGLIGSGIVSTIKNVDIGIGDAWYVPLPDNCQLLFIDIPEQAYIEKNGQTVISEVSQLQQLDNKILGKTGSNKFFSYNTTTNELKEFTTENELIIQNSNIKPNLINAIEFYSDKRNDIAGVALIFVAIASLIISLTAIYLTRKIIVRLTKPKVLT